ncbi:MAG: pyridoxal-phosphate dependent enzyme [Planctomycetes bacterium]|nr:pyridoxal-phosphate dependent enzyme [Planctomycetota bacterium]
MSLAFQKCINPACAADYDIMQVLPKCPKCGNLLDVDYDWEKMALPTRVSDLGKVPDWPSGGLGAVSGVWRFGAMLPFAAPEQRASIGEGHTQLRRSPRAASYAGVKSENFRLQYEGLNPSGSFKDNGMAGALTHAGMVGASVAACASTGNTSASLAACAAASGRRRASIFIGDGKIAYGKLSQALDYGAVTLLVKGDFDDAMARVQEVCAEEGIYLVNSVNPFRLEGQKTTMYRVLEGLDWQVPDWIVCPGGNLGNSSSFGKALYELYDHGLIKKLPRLAVVNSSGAPTLSRIVNDKGLKWNGGAVDDGIIADYYAGLDQRGEKAHTLASAIEINRPVNLKKCLRALDRLNGVALDVSDQAILDAKAWVARDGLGCEPASAASLAGARQLVEKGVIDKDSTVVCILTGHQLKDPHATVAYHSYDEARLQADYGEFGVRTSQYANHPIPVANSLGDIVDVIRRVRSDQK